MWYARLILWPLVLIAYRGCAQGGTVSRQCLLQQGRVNQQDAVRIGGFADDPEHADIFYANIGPGPCQTPSGGEPSHKTFFEKTAQCEMLCTSDQDCKGYAIEGLQCVLYTEEPLVPSDSDTGRRECRTKVFKGVERPPLPPPPLPPQPDQLETPPPPADTLRDKYGEDAERAMSTLKSQISSAVDAQDSIGQNLDKISDAFATASDVREQVDEAGATLRESLKSAKTASQTCAQIASSLRKELKSSTQSKDKLDKQLAKLDGKLKKTNAVVVKSTKAISDMEDKLAKSNAATSSMKEQIVKLESDLDEAKQAEEKSSTEATDLHDKIAKAKTESSKAVAALQKEAQRLFDRASRFSERGKSARDGVITASEELDALQADNAKVTNKLESSTASAQKLREEVDTLQSGIETSKDAAEKLVADLEAQVQVAQEEYDKSEHDLSALEDDLKRSNEDFEQLRDDTADMHTRLTAARKAAKMLDPYNDDDSE